MVRVKEVSFYLYCLLEVKQEEYWEENQCEATQAFLQLQF